MGGRGEVRALRRDAVLPPRALVAGLPDRDPRRLDLRPFLPLVVARDRDEVGARLAAPSSTCGRTSARRSAERTDSMLRREPGVVARADRRRAQQPSCVRLRAEPPEERPVPRDDVVRVEPVEAGRLRASDEWRVPEDANAVERRERRRPLRRGIAIGVVDVEVREAVLLRAVARCPPRRSAGVRPRYGSMWMATSSPSCFAASTTGAEPLVLRRVEAPPRDDDRARRPAAAISRIWADTIFALDDEYRPRLGKYGVESTGAPSCSTYQCAQRPSFVGFAYHG